MQDRFTHQVRAAFIEGSLIAGRRGMQEYGALDVLLGLVDLYGGRRHVLVTRVLDDHGLTGEALATMAAQVYEAKSPTHGYMDGAPDLEAACQRILTVCDDGPIKPEHLLYGLVTGDDTDQVSVVLARHGVDRERMAQQLLRLPVSA